jgi:hypothetical protein
MTNINRNGPYDVNFDGARIDVKASRLYSKKHGRYFDFKLKECHPNCDYFCCIGYRYERDKDPLKVWLIPSALVLDHRRLTIGPNHAGQWKEFERTFESRKNVQLKGAM